MSAIIGKDCWRCLFFNECKVARAYRKYVNCKLYQEGNCKPYLVELLAVADVSVPAELLESIVSAIDSGGIKVECERFQPVPYYYGSPVLSREQWRKLGLLRDIP